MMYGCYDNTETESQKTYDPKWYDVIICYHFYIEIIMDKIENNFGVFLNKYSIYKF